MNVVEALILNWLSHCSQESSIHDTNICGAFLSICLAQFNSGHISEIVLSKLCLLCSIYLSVKHFIWWPWGWFRVTGWTERKTCLSFFLLRSELLMMQFCSVLRKLIPRTLVSISFWGFGKQLVCQMLHTLTQTHVCACGGWARTHHTTPNHTTQHHTTPHHTS